MLWAALQLPRDGVQRRDDPLRGLSIWALQFTPRVAVVSAEAVVMEVEASVRLFKGRRALRDRVVREAPDLGVVQVAWAPTAMAAVALARAGKENGVRRPLVKVLDGLAFGVLDATQPHATTLTQLGCKTLGDIRALPRGGISRRFGKDLLAAMDQAYGLRPEVHKWVELPETFKAQLELPHRVDTAPALLFGARRLIVQMCGWLAARHAGTTAFALRWCHDAMRSRAAGEGGEIVIRTAEAMRDAEHLCRLLGESLAQVKLLAPVGDLEVEALDVHALEERSASLLPDPGSAGESLALVLERIAARLGTHKVMRPHLCDDHRLEWMQQWQPASESGAKRPQASGISPQPTFVLDPPLRLAVRNHRPMHHGPLQLLTGPHRVESGWWHRVGTGNNQHACTVVRDYWLALSEQGAALWVFSERLAPEETAWYLHGIFA